MMFRSTKVILTALNNFTTSRVYDDFTHVVISSHLVLDYDLMFTWRDKSSKNEDIISALFLPLLSLSGVEYFPSRQLARKVGLWQVADKHVS